MSRLIDRLLGLGNKESGFEQIKSFKAQQEKEEAFGGRDRGIHKIPLERIVGSVGRYRDFDSHFRLKRALPSERINKIRELVRKGEKLPPVRLYQIKDEYYVVDGNHRVSVTKEFGHDAIRAHVVEFPPSKNSLENLLYLEKKEFAERTGLPDPMALTAIGQYDYLLKQIEEHHLFFKTSGRGPVSFKEAVADWYKTIYRPLVMIIEKSKLHASFPKRTLADLYTYISFHQWEKGRSRKYGIGIDQLIPKNMEAFREKMADKKEIELPEMKHLISAFVLMNVKVGRDYRIMDKLFEVDGVSEVHMVHGEYDLLVKIMVERDLLSSDAEIVGQVVHNSVRRIPGVLKTQTLIPIASKQKKQDL